MVVASNDWLEYDALVLFASLLPRCCGRRSCGVCFCIFAFSSTTFETYRCKKRTYLCRYVCTFTYLEAGLQFRPGSLVSLEDRKPRCGESTDKATVKSKLFTVNLASFEHHCMSRQYYQGLDANSTQGFGSGHHYFSPLQKTQR